MTASLHLARAHGQQRLRPIQRLDLTLLVHTEHQGPVRRIQVQSDDVPDFLDEQWIPRQFERLSTMGCSANARQMRWTVFRLRPQACAIARVLQWVASSGVVSKGGIGRPLRNKEESRDRPSLPPNVDRFESTFSGIHD
jgi:hypothetical protein